MGVRKVKAYKKLSLRERQRREGVEKFGKKPLGFGAVSVNSLALDRLLDAFVHESSFRHGRDLGNPCVSFDAGVCKLDGSVCDLETEKGRRYLRDFEGLEDGFE